MIDKNNKILDSEKENFSRIFSLKLAEKIEKKEISMRNSANLLVDFVAALEKGDTREIEKIISSF